MLPFIAKWNWFKDDFEQRTGGFHFNLRVSTFNYSIKDGNFFNAWLNIKYIIQCGDRYGRNYMNEHPRLNGVNVRMKLMK